MQEISMKLQTSRIKTGALFVASLFSATIIVSSDTLQNQPLNGVSFFSPRSQSMNGARRIAGMHPYIYQDNLCDNFTLFSITPVYGKSTWPRHLAEAMFGRETVFVAGSYVENRGEFDILADYFGLSPQFSSELRLSPFIRNFLVEPDLYIGLDGWCPGLYFRIFMPVGYTKWTFEIEETIAFDSENSSFRPGYQSLGDEPLSVPFISFTQAIQGNVPFGAVEPLRNDIIGPVPHQGGASDLHAILGWNYLQKKWHFGGYLQAVAPTGSRPKGINLFEPILGNGKHWEFGIGLSGHAIVWERISQELGIYFDATLLHIFKARQKRTFDLKPNGFGSRYILAKIFDEMGEFTGEVTPVSSISHLECNVRNAVQTDIVFMLGYTYDRFVFDVGYNGWIRSREQISLHEDSGILPKRYGLKGIQNVYDVGTGTLDPTTESHATLYEVEVDPTDPAIEQDALADPRPFFLDTSNINLESAASPLAVTHKLFLYLGFAETPAPEKSCIPFIGCGGEIEFEGENLHFSVEPNRETLSQWFIWIRGGIDF